MKRFSATSQTTTTVKLLGHRSLMQKALSISTIMLAVMSSLISTPAGSASGGKGGWDFDIGRVIARGLVRTENGTPILAEYSHDSDKPVNQIGPASGQYQDAVIMSASRYQALLDYYNKFMEENGDGIARGARILTPQQYQGTTFTTVNGTVMYKPRLASGTRSVVVRGDQLLRSTSISPVLFESSINLRSAQTLGSNTQSLLLNPDGNVIYQSQHNIGYRTSFWDRDDFDDINDYSRDGRSSFSFQDQAWAPVPYARVSSILDWDSGTSSREDGKFNLKHYLVPCPGFQHEYRYYLDAEVPYADFNPRNSRGWSVYHANSSEQYYFCSWLSARLAGVPFAGAAYAATVAAESTMAIVIVQSDIRVDVVFLSGQGFLAGPDGPVQVGDETSYDENTGLLKNISQSDLEDTDIYIFRESNGQLVMKRNGLRPEEYVPFVNTGTDADNEAFFYKLMMRGPLATDFYTKINGYFQGYENWNARAGVSPELQQRFTDHLRIGERIQIIAINRPTGYIGMQTTTLASAGDSGEANPNDGANTPGLASFPIQPLVLQPPTLKIRATREYEGVDYDSSSGTETRKYLIGNEGSALSSDTVVAISTEWTGPNGEALPVELEGYTGRLAKIVSHNTLGDSVNNFEIKPGKHLQLIRLPESQLGAEHFYLQVNGESISGNPDFSTLGAGEGKLTTRPKHYVPIQVPYLDRQTTLETEVSYPQEQRASDVGFQQPEYRWAYAPEFQFTTYDLEFEGLVKDEENKLTINYDLSDNGLDPLARFGYDRQFTWYHGPLGYATEIPGLNVFSPFAVNAILNGGADSETEVTSSIPNALLAWQLVQTGDEANVLFDYMPPLVRMGLVSSVGEPPHYMTPAIRDAIGGAVQPSPVFSVNRIHNMGTFNPGIGNAGIDDVTDSYGQYTLMLPQDTKVTIELLDHNDDEAHTYVDDEDMSAGRYYFILTYDDIDSHNILPRSGPDFKLRFTFESDAGSYVETRLGNIQETYDGEVLGQILQHDVLIQRGALSLRREDLSVKGLGPQLNFIRSYNNQQSRGNKQNPLGQGWSHNHNITLRVASYSKDDEPVEGNLPGWVDQFRGELIHAEVVDEIIEDLDSPKPSLIAVSNGGLFKKKYGKWHAQRGHHGTLNEMGESYEFISKDGTKYHFPASNRSRVGGTYYVDSVEDRNGNSLLYTYETHNYLASVNDQSKLVKTVTDASGRVLRFEYSSEANVDGEDILFPGPRLLSVTGPDDLTLNFTYEGIPKDTEVEVPPEVAARSGLQKQFERSSFTERYSYSDKPFVDGYQLASVMDANANLTEYTYYQPGEVPAGLFNYVKALNSSELIKEVTYPLADYSGAGADASGEAKAVFLYDNSGNKRTVRDLRGSGTTYHLNFFGNPTRIEEPMGKTVTMTWSVDQGLPDNVITSRTDPRNNTTSFKYDSNGNIEEETDAYGRKTIRTWNDFSQLLTQKDRNGDVVTDNSYDDKGNLEVQKDGEGYETTHTYYPNGLRRTTTDALDNTTTYDYDGFGNLKTVTAPEITSEDSDSIVVTSYENDVRGRRIKMTDPNGNEYSYRYDVLDRLERIDEPSNENGEVSDTGFQRYTYDAKGNKKTETNRMGLTLTYEYDARDRVKKVTRSFGGGSKNYAYDKNSNLLTESDWKGKKTTYTYDALNRKRTVKNRDSKTMSYDYDLAGNLTDEIDYEGRKTKHSYDNINRREWTEKTIRTFDEQGNPGSETNIRMSYTYDYENNVKTVLDYEDKTTEYDYDKRYLQTHRTDAMGGVFEWQYDDNGNLEKTIDEELREITFTYDELNRKITETDGEGTLAYSHDANGNVTHSTNRRGKTIETEYDGLNRAKTVKDAGGFETEYKYYPDANLYTAEDSYSRITKHIHDTLGRKVVTQTAATPTQITRYGYDLNNNLTTTTDPKGVVYQTIYDELDRPILEIHALDDTSTPEPLQRVKSTDYDDVGNVKQVRDFRGFITEYDYDDLNNRVKTTYPEISHQSNAKYTSSAQYDAMGNLKVAIDRRGFKTSYEYDDLHRLETETDELGQTLEFTYYKTGTVKTETNKRGFVTTHTYDAMDRLLTSTKVGTGKTITLVTNTYDGEMLKTITDAEGNTTEHDYYDRDLVKGTSFAKNTADEASVSFTYDDVGNKKTETDETGQVTGYGYDEVYRLTTVTNPDQEKTSYGYDKNNNRTKITRPKGDEQTIEYDVLNRIDYIEDYEGNKTTYTFDGNDNQLTHVDAMGNRVEYEYDELNRRIKHTQFKPGSPGPDLITSYDYDEADNLVEMINANGQTFTYEYDKLNRQTHQHFPTSAGAGSLGTYLAIETIVTTYDENNNPKTVTETKRGIDGVADVTDVTSFNYDGFDRLDDQAQRGQTIDYSYDDNGNRTGVTSSGGTTTYTYDHRNRLKTVLTAAGTTSYEYTADSKLDIVTYPNGTETDYDYYDDDLTQKVTNQQIDGTLISSFEYDYDANGNRDYQIEKQYGFAQGGGKTREQTTNYDYDSLNRLEGYTVTNKNGTIAETAVYQYDANYNRIHEVKTIDNVTVKNRTLDYDDTNWLTKITNDDNGQTIDYTYDNNGNTLTKVDSIAATPTNTTFYYDSRNQLTQLTRGPPGAEEHQGYYDYNYAGLRVRHRDSERGNVSYLYDDQAVLEERNSDDNSLLAHYRYGDRLISLSTDEANTSNQYYHYSALRTTANLTNDSGDIQASYRTDVWGEITEKEGESVNRQVFTGQEHDEKTGLIYFGARYYDPDIARFINQDSYLGEASTPPSLHRYLYVYSNPTVYVDPDGNKTNKEIMRIDDESVNEDIKAGKTSPMDAAAYAAKQTVYTVWDFATGGFLSRQDDRRYKYDRGQISEKEFHGGTVADAGVTALATVTGGAVGSKVAGKLGGGTAAKLAGAGAGSGMQDMTVQSGQVLTHQATDGRIGQEKIDLKATATSVVAGVATAGIAQRMAAKPALTKESSAGPSKQVDSLRALADAEAGMAYSHPVKKQSVSSRVRENVAASKAAREAAGNGYKKSGVGNVRVKDSGQVQILKSNARGGNYRSWTNIGGDRLARLRDQFDSSGRKNFIKHWAHSNQAARILTPDELAFAIRRGRLPKGWDVHHKKPLKRGGDNSFVNLRVIRSTLHQKLSKRLHDYPEGENPYGSN